MKGTSIREAYRPDIDGLRAIAVLAVVAFHAQSGLFRGGFVGVDVFFVISGYLISGIVFNSLRKGTFTFAEFYTRRINRIFPALIVLLCFVAIAGWLMLFPPEFTQLGKHILSSSGFVNNFVLWKEAGYFDLPEKPLLHLWSLAVEEQFYLMWPIVLVVAWKRRWSIVATAGVIIGVSFAWNIWAVTNYAGTAAFYLPVTRFWEILSGGLLRWSEDSGKSGDSSPRIPANWANAASAAGLLLILGSIRFIEAQTLWPGWLALLPVVGTILLILAGEKALINRRILSLRPLVAIGLISYPLYLWHWPLFVFARLASDGPLSLKYRVAIVAASVILAAATYVLIERPIRFGAHKRRSAKRLFVVMVLAGLSGLVIQRGIVRPRLSDQWDAIVRTEDQAVGPGGYFDNAGHAVGSSIAGDSTATIAILGDSHAVMYKPRFEKLAEKGGAAFPRIVFFTYGGCPPWGGVDRVGISWDGVPWRCNQYHREVMTQVLRPEVKTIVIAAFWEGYFSLLPIYLTGDLSKKTIAEESQRSDSVLRMFERDLTTLTKAGKRTYLVLSNPYSELNSPKAMMPRRLPFLPERQIKKLVPRSGMVARSYKLMARIRPLAERAGVIVIDPIDYVCGEASCPTVDSSGRSIYADSHHFRPSYVRDRVKYLDRVIGSF